MLALTDISAVIFWQYSEGKGFLTQADVERLFRIIYTLGDRTTSDAEMRIRTRTIFSRYIKG